MVSTYHQKFKNRNIFKVGTILKYLLNKLLSYNITRLRFDQFVDQVGLGSAAQPCCVCTEFRKLWPITYWRNSTQPQTNVNGLRSSLAKERVWCFLVDTVDQGLCWYYTTDVVIVVIDLLFRFPSYCDHLASVYRTTSLQTMQVALFHFISLCLKHFYH